MEKHILCKLIKIAQNLIAYIQFFGNHICIFDFYLHNRPFLYIIKVSKRGCLHEICTYCSESGYNN